jgi:hypothetical protein
LDFCIVAVVILLNCVSKVPAARFVLVIETPTFDRRL